MKRFEKSSINVSLGTVAAVILLLLGTVWLVSSLGASLKVSHAVDASDPIERPESFVPFQPDSVFTVDSIAALTSCCSGKCALVLARNGSPLLAGKDAAELFLSNQLTYLVVDTGKYCIGDTVEIFTDQHGDHVHYVPANELTDCER